MKMKLLLLTAALFSTTLFASDWQHRYLKSDEGVIIGADYQLTRNQSVLEARPFFLNVYSSTFTGHEAVRGVLTQECRGPHSDEKVSFVMDLTWHGDHFSADFQDSKLLMGSSLIERGSMYPAPRVWASAGGYGENCNHAVALVIGGYWVRFSGLGNIKFKLD